MAMVVALSSLPTAPPYVHLRRENGCHVPTDYDAPRRPVIEDQPDESLEALTAARSDTHAIDTDVDDTAESFELPGADLSGEELSVRVVPKQADEFTCTSCFLVVHRNRLATETATTRICIDCA